MVICCWFQLELEAAKTEIQKWHSAFQNESFIPAATSPGLSFSGMLYYLLFYFVHNSYLQGELILSLIILVFFILCHLHVEPKLVVSYLQTLKSSEESLREQGGF